MPAAGCLCVGRFLFSIACRTASFDAAGPHRPRCPLTGNFLIICTNDRPFPSHYPNRPNSPAGFSRIPRARSGIVGTKVYYVGSILGPSARPVRRPPSEAIQIDSARSRNPANRQGKGKTRKKGKPRGPTSVCPAPGPLLFPHFPFPFFGRRWNRPDRSTTPCSLFPPRRYTHVTPQSATP